MLRVDYRKYGIRLAHIYFYGDDYLKLYSKLDGCDIAYIHGCTADVPNGVLLSSQHTLIKNIGNTVSEDEMFSSLGKHLRKNIRKCEREDNPQILFYHGEEILNDSSLLQNCKELYEGMFHNIGIENKFNMRLARRFAKANALTLGLVRIEDEIVGFTTMIVDKNNARAWVGAFNFREKKHDGYLLARLHRLLNWRRMIYCKERGISSFDFGGISDFDNPEPRDQFKMEFEQENRTTYKNYLVANSFLGRIVLWAYSIKSR